MNHFSLCTGIAGIDKAAEEVGFKTVGQCELADYPYKVLCKHFPDAPKWRDVRNVTAESVRAAGIGRIDLLSAGYPCQPFSNAGKREGEKDDRHLWPEVHRVIQELQPVWFLGENVAGHISLGLDNVLSDLESEGYEVQPFVIPACAVNSPQQRYRVFIVAHSTSLQRNARTEKQGILPEVFGNWTECNNSDESSETQPKQDVAHSKSNIKRRLSFGEDEADTRPSFSSKNVAYSPGKRCGETREYQSERPEEWTTGGNWFQSERTTQSRLGGMLDGISDWVDGLRWPAGLGQEQYKWEPPRVATGIKHRADRLKALGNAVNPKQVYPILKAIWEVENR